MAKYILYAIAKALVEARKPEDAAYMSLGGPPEAQA